MGYFFRKIKAVEGIAGRVFRYALCLAQNFIYIGLCVLAFVRIVVIGKIISRTKNQIVKGGYS
jgi:hypothetical protein